MNKMKKGSQQIWWIIMTAIIAILVAMFIIVWVKGAGDKAYGGINNKLDSFGDTDKDGVANMFDTCPCTRFDLESDTFDGCPAGWTEEQATRDQQRVQGTSCA